MTRPRSSRLAAMAFAGAVFLCLLAAPASAIERKGVWSLSPSFSIAFLSPKDVNDQIQLDNLAFAVEIEEINKYYKAAAELRYGLSNQVSLELLGGYLWYEEKDGQVTRRITAIPIQGNVVWFLLPGGAQSMAFFAGAGALFNARFDGKDPIGGVEDTGTGFTLQAGIEGEQFVSKKWSLRVRGSWQAAKATDLSPGGIELDLGGLEVQVGLRGYF